jgi:membrane dipeptidase
MDSTKQPLNRTALYLIGATLILIVISILMISWAIVQFLRHGAIKKKTQQKIIVVLAISFGSFFFVIPQTIDATVNSVRLIGDLPTISESTKEFYKDLWVADMHADTLMWSSRDMNKRNTHGHVDIPRLIEGNVAMQIFTIVTKVALFAGFQQNPEPGLLADAISIKAASERWGLSELFSLSDRAFFQVARFYEAVEKSNGQFTLIKSKQDLIAYDSRRQLNKNMTAGVIGIEGLHALGNDINNVDKLYDAGVRIMGLAHLHDNDVAGSSQGTRQYGLTKFGYEILERMAQKKIIIDVAHASELALNNVFDYFQGQYPVPIISTHTGVQGVCNTTRNIADKYIKMIAASGGVVSVAFFAPAICGDNHVASIVASIKYVQQLVGAQYVALGSDFDGAVATPFDSTGLISIAEGLLQAGLSQSDVKLIMGQNVQNLLMKHLP